MANNLKDRTGEINKNINGQLMKIIKYNNYSDIVVEFDDKYKTIVKCQYGMFKNGKLTKPYQYWISMIRRCYSNTKIDLKNNHAYKDCSVCEEWHNFQNFGKWFDDNFYEVDGETMCLDKDILHKGNKIYSPDTYVFVPQNINTLFVKKDCCRGNYPIGVSLSPYGKLKKYRSNCHIFDISIKKSKSKHLGCYDTIKEAFNTYKEAKEDNIKRVADYYKNQIPIKLYNAMYNWEVEITD